MPAIPARYFPKEPDKPTELTKEDVDKRVSIWRTTPIPDDDAFRYHARYFRDWYQKHHAAEVSKKRRAAGVKGRAAKGLSSKPDKRRGGRLSEYLKKYPNGT